MGKSKCRTCGEKILESGNYSVKIVKAKPLPGKVRRLIKSGKIDANKRDGWKGTKFGKFLLKRADQRNNIIEIVCGNCSSSSRIKAIKPSAITVAEMSHREKSTPVVLPSSSGKRKKKPKDVDAGLFIPRNSGSESMSTYEFKSEGESSLSSTTPISHKNPPNKDMDMVNLRKVLFKSKKKGTKAAVKNSAPSLIDFLS